MAAMERKHGTIKLAWLLITFYTCGIGFIYVVLLGIFKVSTIWIDSNYVAGLSGWAVGLAVWSAMEEESEGQSNDRMLFGVIRIPGRVMPYLIIVFYLFLVPDTSLLLHLLAAAVAYLYFTKRIPARLLPSDDVYKHYEGRPWLERITNNSRYVSMDAATGGYLPIHNATSSHISANNSQVTHNVNVGGGSSNNSFPGQGIRLGDE
ncbi:hypothetical protein BDA99DRAFT_498832 [Phascolomyces articulosus]|uniref:Uncharacterized protein n=1 Tax=Phascolomyces articulosus TaxID=60185 RepID=A0AAD5KIX8_9FUNG|nr:hypothetical protein BDA99DRAFT_498832 [Phascolomyces articulosus]